MLCSCGKRAVKRKSEKREEKKASKLDALHFYSVPDGRDCREKGQALRKEDERERGEAVSSWWLVAGS